MCEMDNPDNSARTEFYGRQDEQFIYPENVEIKPRVASNFDMNYFKADKEDGMTDGQLDELTNTVYAMFDFDEGFNKTKWKIIRVGLGKIDFLMVKNNKYKNSALDPVKTFSKVSKGEQLNIRMDDKLSRIKNSDVERKNDFTDLGGYIDLKCVEKDWLSFKDLLD